MHGRALWIATSLVIILQACDPLGGLNLGGWPDLGCGIGLGPRACVALDIVPENINVLRGDAVVLTTFSDSGFGSATWSLTGDAASFVAPGGALVKSMSQSLAAATLKAVTTGSAVVEVQSVVSSHSASRPVFVADSSAVTDLELERFTSNNTVKVGSEFTIFAWLRDADRRAYLARPTSWTISDPEILSPAGRNCPLCSEKFVARKIGTADVVAQFLALRDTMRFIVVP
jgi:hypothetical protein